MTDQPPTAPDASASSAQLAPPEPVPAVAPAASASMVPLDAGALPALDRMAGEFVDSLVALDTKTPEFAAKADSIRTMGDDDIRAAAEVSNRMLETPMRAMGKGSFDEGSKVSNTLVELRRT